MPMSATSDNTLNPFVPERIIFCLDLTDESHAHEFSKFKKGPSRFDTMKYALRSFVQIKQKMSSRHEYALCALKTTTIWCQDFTSNIDQFLGALMKLDYQQKFEAFDFASLFETIMIKCPEIFEEKCMQPQSSQSSVHILPPFVYRVILFYARSDVIPAIGSAKESCLKLLKSPYFFFDVLYLHAKPSKETHPQAIFDFLSEFQSTGHSLNNIRKSSFMFNDTANLKRFYLHVGQLLAHPLQRPAELNEFKIPEIEKNEKK
jgi:hypothetical protein